MVISDLSGSLQSYESMEWDHWWPIVIRTLANHKDSSVKKCDVGLDRLLSYTQHCGPHREHELSTQHPMVVVHLILTPISAHSTLCHDLFSTCHTGGTQTYMQKNIYMHNKVKINKSLKSMRLFFSTTSIIIMVHNFKVRKKSQDIELMGLLSK